MQLPLLPDLARQHRPHNFPVSGRALLVPLGNLAGPVLSQDVRVVAIQKLLLPDFVLRRQEGLSGAAPKKVARDRAAESNVPGRLPAEDNHVGKVATPPLNIGFLTWALTEDTARGEDLLDSAVDQLRGRQAKVTSVVLNS